MFWPIKRKYSATIIIAIILSLGTLALGAIFLTEAGRVQPMELISILVPLFIVCLVLVVEHSLVYQVNSEAVAVRGLLAWVKLPRVAIRRVEPVEYKILSSFGGFKGINGINGVGTLLGKFQTEPIGPVHFYGGRQLQSGVLFVMDDGSKFILTPKDPKRFLENLQDLGFPVSL